MSARVAGNCCAASVERAGLPGLLRDLQRLSEEQESADIAFILGTSEEKIYAHKVIMIARCKSFQNTKRGELCRIPGVTVTPSAGNQPTPIRMAHVQPEAFRMFIQYVYTGKLLLQDSGVFEMMTLAADLGVEDLRSACEDHVTSTLSVESACTLLAAAMEIQEKPGGNSATSFIERCIAFIGENAADCVKTNAFLNLPKEAVIKLLSSDFLCLEEEEVWRAALRWAKQRAGVTQPAAHWTEEERARVRTHLAPLMRHVRLLLIDSTVYAEEVEPTGAVPMELSLERYRRAALTAAAAAAHHSNQLNHSQRSPMNYFPGSVILQQDKSSYQTVLNNWIGNAKQSWRLVFRASTHGYSSQAFHSHCDNIQPVCVLVQVVGGAIVGGYSEVGWRRGGAGGGGGAGGAGGYAAAERAFVFNLTNCPPAHYPLHNKPFAILYHADCGPIFGAGADLFISHNCNTNNESYSNMHSYGEPHVMGSITAEYHFTVRDYELFTHAT